jgi:hypothetical protein
MSGTPFPIDVHTGWVDYSPALHWHATQTLRARLGPLASFISRVRVRIKNHHAAHLDTRKCVIQVWLRTSGWVSAFAHGDDVYETVTRAAVRAQADVQRRIPGKRDGDDVLDAA